jgi:hypothetical protein
MKDSTEKKRLGRRTIRAFHGLLRQIGFRKDEFNYRYAAVLLAAFLNWPVVDVDNAATFASCEPDFVNMILDRMAAGPWDRGEIDQQSIFRRWFDGGTNPGLMADLDVAMGLATCHCGPDGELIYTHRKPN